MTIDYRNSRLPTHSLLRPSTYSRALSVTQSHPQLRDLVVCPWEQPGCASVVCGQSILTASVRDQTAPNHTKLEFPPCSLSYGLGLIAAGGQVGELALRSAASGSTWCYQNMPPPQSASINNAIFITPSPLPSSASRPRVLVSNNARVINVYEVVGAAPDVERSKRRRVRARRRAEGDWDEEEDEVGIDQEEEGGEGEGEGEGEDAACQLEKVEGADVFLPTQINHCSVSPDGRHMVAVGDTNEVFMFEVGVSGTYLMTHVFEGSAGASFSTDWSPNGNQFAVGSEDGTVSIFDLRSLPRSAESSTTSYVPQSRHAPRRVAQIQSFQSGSPRNPGAVRKVKFSRARAGGAPLLGFTEHRSLFHVLDARSFESIQTLDVPAAYAAGLSAGAGAAELGGVLPSASPPHGEIPLERRPPRWAYYRPLDTQPPGIQRSGIEGVAPSRASGLLDGMVRFHAREEAARQRQAAAAAAAAADPANAESSFDSVRASLVDRVEVLVERTQAARQPAGTVRMGAWGIATGAGGASGGGLRWLMAGAEASDDRDILGFDWDEWGERGVIALGCGVVEFAVDEKATRCVGHWEAR